MQFEKAAKIALLSRESRPRHHVEMGGGVAAVWVPEENNIFLMKFLKVRQKKWALFFGLEAKYFKKALK